AALTTITINKADGDITGSEPEKIFNNSRENTNYKETSRERCLRLRREAARQRNERETLENTAAWLKKRREAAIQKKQNQTSEDAARFQQSKRQRYTHIVDASVIKPPNAISPVDPLFITAIPATPLHIISLPIILCPFQSEIVVPACGQRREKTNSSRMSPIFTNCCVQGKVLLPALLDPPPILHTLLTGIDIKACDFRQKIRSYNSALAFTSMGAKINDHVMGTGGVYIFQIHGEMYHNIGSLLPAQATVSPHFAQLYIYDTEHEVLNRMTMIPSLNAIVLANLQQMLDQVNPYVVVFWQVRDILIQELTIILSMVIRAEKLADLRRYNILTANELTGCNADCRRATNWRNRSANYPSINVYRRPSPNAPTLSGCHGN
ncbi:13815_t:CDS:2, partial [Acaulospora morrowiae]